LSAFFYYISVLSVIFSKNFTDFSSSVYGATGCHFLPLETYFALLLYVLVLIAVCVLKLNDDDNDSDVSCWLGTTAASEVMSLDDGFDSHSLAQLLVDGQLTSPTIQLARHHAAAPRAAATFLYGFGPRRSVSLTDSVNPVGYEDGPLEYLLGAPLVDGAVSPFGAASDGYTRWQKVVCAMMLHYWTNFIRTG